MPIANASQPPDMLGHAHPLSESQMRFWKGHRLHPDSPIYNMAWRFDLRFALDVDIFRQALVGTVQENAILRTVFRETDDGPRQFVEDTPNDLLAFVDLSQSAEPEDALAQNLDPWLQEPFDLTQSSIRCSLIKLAEDHWVWAVCQHHIICDAQSGVILFDQVSSRYAAIANNSLTECEPLPSFFESSPLNATEIPPALPSSAGTLSAPYGSNSMRNSLSKRLSVHMSEDTHRALQQATIQPEFRLFTPDLTKLAIFLTAYFGYLHRVTGDDVVTVGLPAHNRISSQDKKTLGLFVEVLPLTVEVAPQDTLMDIHGKVKAGLGEFLRRAKPGAIASADTAAIGAVCNYIHAEFGAFANHPATVAWLHSGAHDAAHAIRLHVTDFNGRGVPELFLDVHNEVLECVRESCLREHFLKVLEATIGLSDTPISALDLVAGEGDRALAVGPVEGPGISETVLQAFAAQVMKSPQTKVLSCAHEQVTFEELDQRSDAVAYQLVDLGVTPGSRVAINMPRSVDTVVTLLGVLKANCAFVPIAANTPEARVAQIVDNSGAAAIYLHPDDDREFSCQSLKTPSKDAPKARTRAAPSGSDLAYVLFTSGSTGVPKGVEVNHANLSRYIHWAARKFSGDHPAHYAFFSSISFDLTLTSLLTPLVTGGSIRIYPERSDPDLAVLDVFAEDAVDVVKLTPSHLALACKQGISVERIRTLILGGENLTSQLCRRALRVLSPSLTIINEYGPTEAVVGAMDHTYQPAMDKSASVQIGRPADGMSIGIRDKGMNFCPLGVTGEIVIGGRLAQGYLGAPSATAEKFINDPLEVQSRVYRTGDLGRINTDGSFDYLGRADEQVKIGGVRVEVAEFDRVLQEMDNVNSVHVAYESPPAAKGTKQCKSCGLTDAVPNVEFHSHDLCGVCAEFDSYKDRAKAYFKDEAELRTQLTRAAQASTGEYDAIMMLSGGKDSTYAAYRLAECTSRVLAVTLDNGYISEQSKTNIQRVVEDLGWDHRYLSTDKMNQIFVDSLKTHSNVCQGCFKALYTLAFRTALAEGVAMVVTGLSRGQFFETRLTPELFRNAAPTCAQLDDMVAKARKAYHAEDDALSRLLETDDLKDGRFLNEVEVLDIYRYIDVPVSEIYDFLETRTAWQRPSDTGRSTNCLINDAGIYLHKAREGYHNYALPYSWDVRMGHKTREQALDELNDEIDTQHVEAILEEIGFDEPTKRQSLSVYVAGEGIDEQQVWQTLRAQFPVGLLPDRVVILENIPLSANGKIDVSKLPMGRKRGIAITKMIAPATDTEKLLSAIFAEVLRTSQIGVTDDFFGLGVDSLAAIEIAMTVNKEGIQIPATALFEYRTIRALASYADELPSQTHEHSSGEPLLELDAEDLESIWEALG